jgi:predicted ATPase
LRALALITALAQPESGLPLVSSIDEPELGLHPAALGILCGLISSAAQRKQVIVSTQSPIILDHVEPNQVIVTERQDAATVLRRLDESALQSWLEDYSLSQLYDKNVLGGRP